MAMQSEDLQKALENIFDHMNDLTDPGDADDYFAENVASEIANYATTAGMNTTDTGSVGSDTYVGATTGAQITQISASTLESGLKSIFSYMSSSRDCEDEYFAAQFASYWKSMIAAATITGTSIGTETPPSPASPFATTLSMSGQINVAGSTLQDALEDCFRSMGNMTEGGNQYFAQELATAITKELTDATIVTFMDTLGGVQGVKVSIA